MKILKSFGAPVWSLMTPKNITYLWGFGSLLGFAMLLQILSGLLLAFYYVSGMMGWESVIEITREVSSGWILRLFHSNMASFVFIVLFVHFFRGVLQSSFYLKGPWITGCIIMILIMASAFLGYVLPWGQMSFWGATVIINLLSVLPKGKMLVIWLWGGFYVSSFTCSFFYALHFLVPLVVMMMAVMHLFLLHFTGSSVPTGLGKSSALSIKFSHFFLYKDIINMVFIWSFLIFAFIAPDWSADPVNFVSSDLTNSPIHIQPEWYFLHLYAILRSIPNKMGGLVGFFLAIVLLFFLSIGKSESPLSKFYLYTLMSWSFFSSNLILLWLGMQAVEAPFILMGQLTSGFYFLYFFMKFLLDIFVI